MPLKSPTSFTGPGAGHNPRANLTALPWLTTIPSVTYRYTSQNAPPAKIAFPKIFKKHPDHFQSFTGNSHFSGPRFAQPRSILCPDERLRSKSLRKPGPPDLPERCRKRRTYKKSSAGRPDKSPQPFDIERLTRKISKARLASFRSRQCRRAGTATASVSQLVSPARATYTMPRLGERNLAPVLPSHANHPHFSKTSSGFATSTLRMRK